MSILIQDVFKSYNGRPVLRGVSCEIPSGSRWAILAPSGAGKTTLLRLLLGLEAPDSGHISGVPRAAVLFQENRLLSRCSAIRNLRMTVPRAKQEIPVLLTALGLDQASQEKPVCQLSGGQARRVALARALLAPGALLILDEPFTGLDEETHLLAARCIQSSLRNRTLLLVTHRTEDLPLLGIRQCIHLPSWN